MKKTYSDKAVTVLLSFFSEKKRFNIIKTSKFYQIKLGYLKEDFALIDSLAEVVKERYDMSAYLHYYTMKYPNIDKLSIESYLLTYFKEYCNDSPIYLSNEGEFTAKVISVLSKNIVLNIDSLNEIKGVDVVNSEIKRVNVRIENISKEDIEILFDTLIPRKVREINFEMQFLPEMYEIEPDVVYNKINKLTKLRKMIIQEQLYEEDFFKNFGELTQLETISIILPNLNPNQRKMLKKNISAFASLNEINLTFMSKPSFKIWSIIPSKYKSIQSLSLSNINIKSSLKLNELERIEKLSLSKVSFATTNIGLEDIKSLKEFTITDAEISLNGLAMILLNNPLLSKLKIKLNQKKVEVTESAATFLTNAIQSLRCLTELTLDCHPFVTIGQLSLINFIVTKCNSPMLERLSIENDYRSSIIEIFVNSCSLSHLSINYQNCIKTDESIYKSAIKQFAKQFVKYKTVSLTWYCIKEAFVEGFLFNCVNIENINLNGSMISSKNLRSLLHNLHRFTNLKTFFFVDIRLENNIYPDLEEIFPKFNWSINHCTLLEEFKFSIKDHDYENRFLHYTNGIPLFPFMRTLQLYPLFFEALFLSAHDLL